MQKVTIRSPIRVDLAGGTVDCWPLCQIVQNATTINYGLELFTFVELERISGGVTLHSADLNWEKSFESREQLLKNPDPQLLLFQVVIEQFPEIESFKLTTRSESPVGAGLGGSSSLIISLLKAFRSLANRDLSDIKMVELACNLETRLLGKPAGTQDYFPAVYGGVNLIEYKPPGPQWSLIKANTQFLGDLGVLVYTGRAHHSGLNNWEVIQKALNGDSVVLSALKEVAYVAGEMKKALEMGNVDLITSLFKEELVARLKLAPAFSSPEIEKLASLAESRGAALKICGAGGGGCVLVLAKSKVQKAELNMEIEKIGFRCFSAAAWIDPECPI